MTDIGTRTTRGLAGGTVLQVVPALRADSIGSAALDLAVALLRSGARALVAAGGGKLAAELQTLGGEWIEQDFSARSLFRRRRAARELGDLIRSERVDLVHAHGAEAARACLAAVRSTRTPFATTYAGMPPAPGWGRTPEDAQARGDIVFACSEFAAGLIAERHSVGRDRLVVMPRRVDTLWFDPAAVAGERVAALREAWRIRPGVRVVLAPGKMVPSQGHFTLVDAVRSLVNGGLRGVAFVIAGDGPADEGYAAAVDERIVAQGLGPIFRHAGRCADMPAAYAAADLVVWPADRADLFSSVVVEAQAMARPVIAGRIGALPELILAPPPDSLAPRTGWLIDSDDPLDLARVLAAALGTDRAGLHAVGRQARAFAQTHFSPDRTAAAAVSAYERLLRAKP